MTQQTRIDRRQELLDTVKTCYWPDYEGAPRLDGALIDIERLYQLPPNSLEYLKLKSDVITYLAMNCIEQFQRGKEAQGFHSRRILERLITSLALEKEDSGDLVE